MVIFVQSNTFINLFNIDKCILCKNIFFNNDFKYMCNNKHVFHFNCITNYVCTKNLDEKQLIECCRRYKLNSQTVCPCIDCNININLKDLKILKIPDYRYKYFKYKYKYLNIINNN